MNSTDPKRGREGERELKSYRESLQAESQSYRCAKGLIQELKERGGKNKSGPDERD